jgi:hypothetical protein
MKEVNIYPSPMRKPVSPTFSSEPVVCAHGNTPFLIDEIISDDMVDGHRFRRIEFPFLRWDKSLHEKGTT